MTQIKLRRDTSSAFASSNPILGNGEPAYETDTKKLKIGDGTTAYTQLEYFSAGGGSTDITATLPLKIVDGVISLEVDGQTIQIVDGKLTATGSSTGGLTIDDILPDYTARIEIGGYTSVSNQFTAPCAGYIVPLIGLAFNTDKYAPYINGVRHGYAAIDQTPSVSFSDVFFIINKGDKFYAEGITSYLDAGGFYPMKGANK